MYTIMIVEDELPAIEILKSSVDWPSLGFEIAGIKRNGEEGLKFYKDQHPDLIITDIQMPLMDGLEMIEEIVAVNPSQKIVILSCHENFHFAKQAMKLGIDHYLIKDLMTPAELQGVLNEIRFELEEQASDNLLQNFIDKSDFKNEIKRVALKQFVDKPITKEALDNYIANLGLNLKGDYFHLMLLSIDDYKKYMDIDKSKIDTLLDNMDVFFQQFLVSEGDGEVVHLGDDQYLFIRTGQKINSNMKYMNDCQNFFMKLLYILKERYEISVTVAVSQQIKKGISLTEPYAKLTDLIQYRMFLGKGSIIFNDSVITKSSLDPSLVKLRTDKIDEAISSKNMNVLNKQIVELYCNDLRGIIQYNYIDYVNMLMLEKLERLCRMNRVEYEQIFGQHYIPVGQIGNLDTSKDIANWFVKAFSAVLGMLEVTEGYSKKVKDAVLYIGQNYQDPQLDLSVIAEAVGSNKAYLSRIFKLETGMTMTDYINTVRIDKAKELINGTNYKLYEIAEMVGYISSSTFSVIFKKVTGKSPGSYKD